MTAPAGKVVVVTGASAGLGREVARQLASRGDAVALAARRRDALEETERLCLDAGGDALVVPTDITEEDQVRRLADQTLERWGRIDVWVNNAGVTVFAPLEGGPFDEHRRVIETNVFGAMFGARAVVPIFRRQGRGVLINVGSILSKIGQPFVPSYVISKFALRGLTETLRTELADHPDIHVCSIFPYAIDTQHFQSGANRVGWEARAMPPMQSPEKVARAIVELADHPHRERHVPRLALAGLAAHALVPRTTERLLLRTLRQWHFGWTPEPKKRGNLFRPSREKAHVHGERPPQLAPSELAGWVARQLVQIEVESMQRKLGRWRQLARTLVGRNLEHPPGPMGFVP